MTDIAGTAMAIEDAAELSQLLSGVTDSTRIRGAARGYESSRRKRTAAVQAASIANTKLWHLEDGEKQVRVRPRRWAAKQCYSVKCLPK